MLIPSSFIFGGALAEKERALTGKRSREALAAAQARGVKLGGDPANLLPHAAAGNVASAAIRGAKADAYAGDVLPMVRELQDTGMSLRAIAADLAERGVHTPRGGLNWTAASVQRVLARIA